MYATTHLGDTGQWGLGFKECVCGLAQLRDLLIGEAVRPFLRVVDIVFWLPYGWAGDLFGVVLVGLQLLVYGRMLSGGLETIGEEGFGDRASLELLVRSCCLCYWSSSGICKTWCHCIEWVLFSNEEDADRSSMLDEEGQRRWEKEKKNASKGTELNDSLYIFQRVLRIRIYILQKRERPEQLGRYEHSSTADRCIVGTAIA